LASLEQDVWFGLRTLAKNRGFVVAAVITLSLGIGLALGLAAALALSRTVSSLLYGVSHSDPATFAVIVIVLAGVSLIACYVPARRASLLEPLVGLRRE